MERETLKLALEALEEHDYGVAQIIIREALAQPAQSTFDTHAAPGKALDTHSRLPQPAQEPVAWTLLLTGEHHGIIGKAKEKFIGAPECYQRVNVYTTPPKRKWVGLTDEEIHALPEYAEDGVIYRLIRAAEAALRRKNNG